jgi:hexosaminidase
MTGAAAESPHSVIPAPREFELKTGRFVLSETTVVVPGPGATASAERLAADLRAATGFKLPLEQIPNPTSAIRLELAPDPQRPAQPPASAAPQNAQTNPAAPAGLGDEAYHLSISPTVVVIRAPTEKGLFYGGITLRQLLPPEACAQKPGPPSAVVQWSAPCVEIADGPRFVWRGLLLDVARHYMPPAFLKKMVDLAALHKFNVLQLHLTDDQGWRVQIRKYPKLTDLGSLRKESPLKGDRNRGDGQPYGPFFYTQAELRDLVAYAQARHVTILPEIEMPGHFLAALTAYPQYSCRGGPFQVRTRWGIEPDILCAGNESAIQFVQDILSEVLEMFPSPFIHIGGDEAPRDRWKTCPKCQARIRAEGLRGPAELQTYLNHRIEQFLAAKGRRLIGWDEILEGGLTPGAAVMSWRGIQGGIAAAQAGHDVVMSPTSHCYLDYAQAHGPSEPECIGGFIPLELVYAYEPLPPSLPAARQRHILGTQGNIWTEFIWTPADVEYFAFPRAVALAEVAWSAPHQRNFNDFRHRLTTHLKRLDALEVNYRKETAKE